LRLPECRHNLDIMPIGLLSSLYELCSFSGQSVLPCILRMTLFYCKKGTSQHSVASAKQKTMALSIASCTCSAITCTSLFKSNELFYYLSLSYYILLYWLNYDLITIEYHTTA